MAIELIKEKISRKQDSYYIIKYNYMIGDSNGYTSETTTLSADNPFIERYCKILNKLQATKGYWGISLSYGNRMWLHEEGQITLDEYNFLTRLAFPEYLDEEEDEESINYFKTDQENGWADEFADGVRSETEYSFLVFQGIELKYVDENGKKHKTKFID
jgi:hypothetical protein